MSGQDEGSTMNWREAMKICRELQDKPIPIVWSCGRAYYNYTEDTEGLKYSNARHFLTYTFHPNLMKLIAPRFGVKL